MPTASRSNCPGTFSTDIISMHISLTQFPSIMSVVKVSSKYQIVIPQDVREQSGLRPGDEVDVMFLGGVLHVVKVPTIREAQELLKGVSLDFVRDKTGREL
ncbi:MAG: AbrB family looped-hinge helix DNA binding protein [Rhodothermales bacterium]|jgi:AbrB family looped-hinge helix DNA binding protein